MYFFTMRRHGLSLYNAQLDKQACSVIKGSISIYIYIYIYIYMYTVIHFADSLFILIVSYVLTYKIDS